MIKHCCNPEACGFQRLAGRDEISGRRSGALPGHDMRASCEGVLALYPSTTTELPFT